MFRGSVGDLEGWSVNLDAVPSSENTQQVPASFHWAFSGRSWSRDWSWRRRWKERERSRDRFGVLVMILTLLTPEDVLTHLLALLLRDRGAGLPGDSHTLLLGLSHTLLSAGSKAGVNIVLTAWSTLIGRG